MRVHFGPGYRVYFTRSQKTVYFLLCGGDKSSQRRDIERAKAMARKLKETGALIKLAPFRASDHLDSAETIAEYLTAASEDENPDVLLSAIAEVARAQGMARVAADAGLGRESLYKTLAPGSHPRFETIATILRALGVQLSFDARP